MRWYRDRLPECSRLSLTAFLVIAIVSVSRAEYILSGRPFNVVGDEQIEAAVAIVIEPEGGGAESLTAAEPGAIGHVGESAIAVVLEKPVLADCGDVEIGISVVVEIACCHAHAIHLDVEAGAARDFGKRAVAIVAVERKSRAAGLVTGPIGAVDEENVLPAVFVEIENSDAWAEGFGKVFAAESTAVVDEADSGVGGDVGQAEARDRRLAIKARRPKGRRQPERLAPQSW